MLIQATQKLTGTFLSFQGGCCQQPALALRAALEKYLTAANGLSQQIALASRMVSRKIDMIDIVHPSSPSCPMGGTSSCATLHLTEFWLLLSWFFYCVTWDCFFSLTQKGLAGDYTDIYLIFGLCAQKTVQDFINKQLKAAWKPIHLPERFSLDFSIHVILSLQQPSL